LLANLRGAKLTGATMPPGWRQNVSAY
jgi:hypothetical protein